MHNTEAELAVLGCITHDNDSIYTAQDILIERDFYESEHVHLFRWMLEQADTGKPIDVVGSPNKELFLRAASQTASPANLEHYCNLVLDCSKQRALLDVGSRVRNLAEDTDDVEQALSDAEGLILGIRRQKANEGLVPAGSVVDGIIREQDRRAKEDSSVLGIPTGFRNLDKMLGGLRPGHLTVLAARPGMGKTAFMLELAIRVAGSDLDRVVAIASLEMRREELVTRMMSRLSGIPHGRLERGFLLGDERIERSRASDALSEMQILIDDKGGQKMAAIAGKCRRCKAEHGLDLVMVDYLQLTHGDKGAGREQEVAGMSMAAKNLAKELDVPVVLLSQLNRGLEKRDNKRPNLSDLRDSGSIEQDADEVLFIHRPARFDDGFDERETELIIGKNRHGDSGTVMLDFDLETQRFEEAK